MTADVTTTLDSWSTTASSNQPDNTDNIGPTTLAENLRTIQAVTRQIASSGTIASAATTDLSTVTGTYITVTGTTTITGLGTLTAGMVKWLVFSGALTLTHNATSLILPTSANITTAAGDVACMLSLGSGNWRCLNYARADGISVAGASSMLAGTEALPGLSVSGDTDTGVYQPAANQLGFSCAGAAIAHLTSTGLNINPDTDAIAGAILTASNSSVSGTFISYSNSTAANGNIVYINAAPSGSNAILKLDAPSTIATSQKFIDCLDNGDREFEVDGSGNVSSDGGTAMTTPADYAEMFEWSDGNPDNEDRVGISVVLVGNQIRPAALAEQPIGIVSGNPAVLGDAGGLRWTDKYLRDDFNRPVLNDDGTRKLNPDFDPSAEYTPRIERKEWSPIGLVGKLRLRKGQPTAPRWVKMRDISATVEEWLVI